MSLMYVTTATQLFPLHQAGVINLTHVLSAISVFLDVSPSSILSQEITLVVL